MRRDLVARRGVRERSSRRHPRSDVDDGLDQDEEAHEEEQRRPLDLPEHLVGVERATSMSAVAPRRAIVAASRPSAEWEEADEGQAHDDQGPDQQRPVR